MKGANSARVEEAACASCHALMVTQNILGMALIVEHHNGMPCWLQPLILYFNELVAELHKLLLLLFVSFLGRAQTADEAAVCPEPKCCRQAAAVAAAAAMNAHVGGAVPLVPQQSHLFAIQLCPVNLHSRGKLQSWQHGLCIC